MTDILFVPTSWGDLIDKITILEIKVERLPSDTARANAARELELLNEIGAPALLNPGVQTLVAQLKSINATLWDIENAIREHERSADFGETFIALARAIYHHNDQRGAIKRQLNLALGSGLIEEKSYSPY